MPVEALSPIPQPTETLPTPHLKVVFAGIGYGNDGIMIIKKKDWEQYVNKLKAILSDKYAISIRGALDKEIRFKNVQDYLTTFMVVELPIKDTLHFLALIKGGHFSMNSERVQENQNNVIGIVPMVSDFQLQNILTEAGIKKIKCIPQYGFHSNWCDCSEQEEEDGNDINQLL